MSKFSKFFVRFFALVSVCLIATITLFATGIIDPPVILDIYDDKEYVEQTEDKDTQNSTNQNLSSSGNITISSNTSTDVNSIPSVLTIKLKGDYLTAFNKATKNLPANDKNSRVLIKVGLQILQSKTISYENALHFYALGSKAAGYQRNAKTYNLRNVIDRINSGSYIYTDCFGFVRLTHSIACYTLNNKNPEEVSGLSGLYGYKGAYSQGKEFNSLQKLKSGAVIYDCLTGSGSGERHVAMFLYSNGTEVVFMDQSGLHTGTFRNGNHIYSPISSTPYKFNKFKNYN